MPRTKNFDPAEVLEKAKNLFWEKGYYATSMQDLVDTLGINRASMYDTYGGKDQLFAKALETPGGLKIQTIHGFCSGVLRKFPLEINIAPNFKILDDRQKQDFLVNSI